MMESRSTSFSAIAGAAAIGWRVGCSRGARAGLARVEGGGESRCRVEHGVAFPVGERAR
jgi:hypothetical protein